MISCMIYLFSNLFKCILVLEKPDFTVAIIVFALQS